MVKALMNQTISVIAIKIIKSLETKNDYGTEFKLIIYYLYFNYMY